MSDTRSWDRALSCARHALEKKAYDLVILEVAALTSVADYFVLCTGRSDTQVQAITRSIDESLRKDGVLPLALEGYENAQWVLLDYGDVLVHVFYEPIRRFYDLERLWSRAPRPALPEPFLSQSLRPKTGTD